MSPDELKAIRERAETRVNTVMAAHDRRALLGYVDELRDHLQAAQCAEKMAMDDVRELRTLSAEQREDEG
jgi:hypothetical protein